MWPRSPVSLRKQEVGSSRPTGELATPGVQGQSGLLESALKQTNKRLLKENSYMNFQLSLTHWINQIHNVTGDFDTQLSMFPQMFILLGSLILLVVPGVNGETSLIVLKESYSSAFGRN